MDRRGIGSVGRGENPRGEMLAGGGGGNSLEALEGAARWRDGTPILEGSSGPSAPASNGPGLSRSIVARPGAVPAHAGVFEKVSGKFREAAARKRSLAGAPAFGGVIGTSPAILAQVKLARRYAMSDFAVLILGESGTGKEVFARAIHECGPRAAGPFVALNCAGLSDERLENDLFGHEQGAYTGALTQTAGLVAEAEGGTLFLDEVDSPSVAVQSKLLRFLQDQTYRLLGGRRLLRGNVRIVAATNADLSARMADRRFRDDLFYRLAVHKLRLPALRDRPEDIPLLVEMFLKDCSRRGNEALKDEPPWRSKSSQTGDNQNGSDIRASSPRLLQCSAEAMGVLQAYRWPGNVRELENVIKNALIVSDGPLIEAADLGEDVTRARPYKETFKQEMRRRTDLILREVVKRYLAENGGNITRAAAAAGKNRRVFWELMRRAGVTTDRGMNQTRHDVS